MFNIPTALSKAETDFLLRVCRNLRVVEAGALLGYSTLVMGSVASHVTSIDRHEGYSGSTFNRYTQNLHRYSRGNVRTVCANALTALPGLVGDVAFIDLTGDEALTRNAVLALNPSIRLALVHDLGRVACDGVAAALNSLRDWRLIEGVDTIGVIAR